MQTGDRVGRYLLEHKLGEGAMACVFAARHPQLEPPVALKMLRPEVGSDRHIADRFLEDARTAATLNHPNIVGVRDFDVADGMPFIVMEWVDGQTLEHLLAERGQLKVAMAARIAHDIALALGAAHAAGIVHRDVKPSNVLIDRQVGTAKLTDFGAAKRERPDAQALTAHGQTIGTPRYMAPEQINGEAVDARSDLWALGATLYEMLAGRPAFQAGSLAKLYLAILQEPPEPLDGLRPGLPPELRRLVERLLAKNVAERPDSATEVARILAPFTDPKASVVAGTPARPSDPPTICRRRGRLVAGGGAIAVLVVAAFAAHSMGLLDERGSERQNPSIAVLPFVNLGGDARADRLAGGLTEDLITDLSRFRNLDVIAPESLTGHAGGVGDARRLARDLGVRYALQGSLQQEGGQVRVTAQLLDVGSGAHLWGERWDRSAQDVFAIQSEVAEAVAGQLGGYHGAIVTVDLERAARKRPDHLGAYDQYLLGLADLGTGSQAGVESAIRRFERSIAIDPKLARAWTGLARANLQLRDHVEDGRSPLQRSIESARRAVALDPRDGEAAAALGVALGEQGSLAESEAMFDRALALNLSSSEILTAYASWASTFGKPEEGVAAARRALELNPNMPPTALRKHRYAFFMSGGYDEALRLQARIPPEAYGREEFVYRAVLLNETGNSHDAQSAVAAALERFPNLSVEAWSGQAGYSDAERQRWVTTMRAAGFPLCASEAVLTEQAVVRRMPECLAQTAS